MWWTVTKSFFSQLVPDSQADPHAPTCARGSGLCPISGSSGFPCGLPRWFSCKESTCNAGGLSSVPGLARSPGKGNDNPVKQASILAWEIPRAEEPGGLQSVGSQTVGHDLATKQQQFCSRRTVTLSYCSFTARYPARGAALFCTHVGISSLISRKILLQL